MRFFFILKGPIARSTISTSGVLGVRLLMQTGTLLILAHLLEPTGFGIYVALGALAVMLGALASFGTHLILLRDVTRDETLRENSIRLALGTTLLCGSVLFFVYMFAVVHWLLPARDEIVTIVCLGISEFLLQPALLIASMERHARHELVRSQLLLVMPLALRLIFAASINWIAPENSLSMFAVCYALSVAFTLVFAIASAPLPWPLPWQWRIPRRTDWRDASGYAFLNVSAIGVAELDKLLATKLLAAGPAGVYAAASRVVGALVLPVVALVISAMPRLFKQDTGSGRKLHSWIFICSATYGGLAGIAIWNFAPIFQSIFGNNYTGLEDAIRWLAWAVPGISLRAAAVNILTATDRPWLRVFLELTGWIILISSSWIFASSMGIQGVAFSVMYSEWVVATGAWISVYLQPRVIFFAPKNS